MRPLPPPPLTSPEEVAARAVWLVVGPLALVRVAAAADVGAGVLTVAVVHPIAPLALVGVAARVPICARTRAPVVLPLARVDVAWRSKCPVRRNSTTMRGASYCTLLGITPTPTPTPTPA